jgi:hypothetical protein
MDLKDFVATTLADLIQGMIEAQPKIASTRAHINPGNLMRNASETGTAVICDNRTNNYARTVNFDIALTVEEGTATGGKVGVAAGLFSFGANGNSDNRQVAVNRVQFSVPALFPTSDLPAAARQNKVD